MVQSLIEGFDIYGCRGSRAVVEVLSFSCQRFRNGTFSRLWVRGASWEHAYSFSPRA